MLAGVLGLSLVELRHLAAQPADFASWNLSVPAFEPLLRVCDHALLRDELRASGDELVDIYQEARATPEAGQTPADVRDAVLELVATFSRRPVEIPGPLREALQTLMVS